MNSGIGYNKQAIKDLENNICQTYVEIGKKLVDEWPLLSSTMEKEWIGPDEVSFENVLAEKLKTFYINLKDQFNIVIQNIEILEQRWIDHQNNNRLDGSNTYVTLTNEVAPTLSLYGNLEMLKAGAPVFSENTTLGLASGNQSSTNISSAFNSYATNVKGLVSSKFEAINSSAEASGAFIDVQMQAAIKNYFQSVKEFINYNFGELAKLLDGKLLELTATYATVNEATVAEVNSISTN